MGTGNLIIAPEGAEGGGTRPDRLTRLRVVEADRVIADCRQALRVPRDEELYITLQIGILETPEGYIVIDEEGGHMKLPMMADERVTLLIWSRLTGQPRAEAPVAIKELLRYTNKRMPAADFVSNRDGMEERWDALVITLKSAGIFDTAADEARRKENARNKITGGAQPFDLEKTTLIETE